jgi:hypothetical protein
MQPRQNLTLFLIVTALAFLVVGQALTFRRSGWNPGMIAGAGLMTALLIRELRAPR